MMGPVVTAVRATLDNFRHGGMAPFFGGLLRRTRFDYRKEVGDCLDASVVMAPVQWMQRLLPEATLMVQRKNRKGETHELPEHLMLSLIQNPNPHYGDKIGRAQASTPVTNAQPEC